MQEMEGQRYSTHICISISGSAFKPASTNPPSDKNPNRTENPTNRNVLEGQGAVNLIKHTCKHLTLTQTSCESWPSHGKCTRCTCLWQGMARSSPEYKNYFRAQYKSTGRWPHVLWQLIWRNRRCIFSALLCHIYSSSNTFKPFFITNAGGNRCQCKDDL